jgi:hypothetical protein
MPREEAMGIAFAPPILRAQQQRSVDRKAEAKNGAPQVNLLAT